jgi:ethanolamine utilization microcompartment shell protein EutL
LNCTLVVLEEELVVIGTMPETVAPMAGEVIEMLGAPELATVTETVELKVV